MENMQKALIMAGSVFMFIIAISVAMFSYNIVREVNDSVLLSSENYAKSAEYFVANTDDTERYATKAEIVMAIYSLDDDDYVPNSIIVKGTGGYTFTKSDFLSVSGRDTIENKIGNIPTNGKYSVSYDFSNIGDKRVIYTPAS